MPTVHGSSQLDRSTLVSWYRRNRECSRALFDMLADGDAYYSQPIALRHPIVFYEGHLPAFSFNTLVKRALGGAGLDPALERLFARGIDPARAAAPVDAARNREVWPERGVVQRFGEAVDRAVIAALEDAQIDRPGHPLLDRADAVFTILEHEAMHHETLLYMWHRLPFDAKRRPAAYAPGVAGATPSHEWIEVPPGRATLGVDRDRVVFGWDNEHPSCVTEVDAFAIERHNVTNAAYLEYLDASGAQPPLFWERHDGRWFWRGMFDLLPLPLSWPVYVTHEEATAYARRQGARLPTEAEFQRAAYGAPSRDERRHPWGSAPPGAAHGVFDFQSWDPQPAGSHPPGRSAWGVDDLVGNGWEWTSTRFAPFPGFTPMPSYPEYSADFFDDEHFVLKGASPATARELLRPTFRNWFRSSYPYVYAAFRCVRVRA